MIAFIDRYPRGAILNITTIALLSALCFIYESAGKETINFVDASANYIDSLKLGQPLTMINSIIEFWSCKTRWPDKLSFTYPEIAPFILLVKALAAIVALLMTRNWYVGASLLVIIGMLYYSFQKKMYDMFISLIRVKITAYINEANNKSTPSSSSAASAAIGRRSEGAKKAAATRKAKAAKK